MVAAVFFVGCGGDDGGGNPGDPGTDPGTNPGTNPGGGSTFTDSRDNKSYKKVKIGNQTWMAQNLDRATTDSKCYLNSADSCAKYGRLYTWSDAKAACPSGWHLPTNAEWDQLYRYADGTTGTDSPYAGLTAGRKLKAQDGWNSSGPSGSGKTYVCEDAFGFAALPGGDGNSDGDFDNAGYVGNWWSASEDDTNGAYLRYMGNFYEFSGWNSYYKSALFSVRCIQN